MNRAELVELIRGGENSGVEFKRAEHRSTPSEAFRRYFGPEQGVELPGPGHYAYRNVEFVGESGT